MYSHPHTHTSSVTVHGLVDSESGQQDSVVFISQRWRRSLHKLVWKSKKVRGNGEDDRLWIEWLQRSDSRVRKENLCCLFFKTEPRHENAGKYIKKTALKSSFYIEMHLSECITNTTVLKKIQPLPVQHNCRGKAKENRVNPAVFSAAGWKKNVHLSGAGAARLPFANQACPRTAGLLIPTQAFIKSAACVAQAYFTAPPRTRTRTLATFRVRGYCPAHVETFSCLIKERRPPPASEDAPWRHRAPAEAASAGGLKRCESKRAEHCEERQRQQTPAKAAQHAATECEGTTFEDVFISFDPKAACERQPESLFP